MAKKRFPSDANQPKPTVAGQKSSDSAQCTEKVTIEAKSQELVSVEYKKDNHHILGTGVHALRRGVNHLPKSVWEDAKLHPSVKSMIESGHIVGPECENESDEDMQAQNVRLQDIEDSKSEEDESAE